MKKAFLASALVFCSPVFAEEPASPTPPPKTYEQGVCAGYRSATTQVAQARQQLLAIILGSRSEAVGLMVTMMDNVIFAQLDPKSVNVDGAVINCNEEPK